MLKLSQNALGMLLAQYRAVFRRCFLKNAAALAVGGLICAAPAPAAAVDYYNSSTETTIQYANLQALRTAVSSFNSGDKITITSNDSTLTGALNFNGADVTIDFQNTSFVIAPASTGACFLALDAANVTLANASQATISGFKRTGSNYGGALYLTSDSTLDAAGAAFTGNSVYRSGSSAIARGGAAYLTSSTLSAAGATFKSNSVSTSSSGSSAGGAVYLISGSTLNAADASFIGNSASGSLYSVGGAIYASGSTINVNNAEFTDNFVSTSASTTSGSASTGGAVYLVSNSTLNAEGAQFTSNYASGLGGTGGAVYASSSTAVNIKGASFTSNTASSRGGAMYVSSSTVSASGAAFKSNTAHDGGAIFAYDSTVSAESAEFVNNYVSPSSSSGYGGAAYLDSSTVNAAGATFTNNYASAVSSYSAYGGAVYLTSSSTLNAEGTNFEGNYASSLSSSGHGGALYLEKKSTVNAAEASFLNNTATSSGGAVYATSSTVNAAGASFTDNSAASSGGAVYAYNSTVNTEGATFTSNTASSGGAVYAYNSTVNTESATFTANTASTSGGAVYLTSGSTLNARNASFLNNIATSSGGAIYTQASSNGSTITLGADAEQVSTFSGNKANGQANSIYFDGYLNGTNTLTVDGEGTLDMLDPMNSGTGIYNIKITKTGDGTWKLDGSNLFNANGTTGTTFTVEQGILELYKNASITINNTGSFTLGGTTGATLLSNGGNVITADSITLSDGSILGFDLTNATTADTSLTFNGAFESASQTIGDGEIKIYNSGSDLAYGTYTLVDGSGATGTNFASDGTLYYNDSQVSSIIGRSDYELFLANTTTTLQLKVADTSGRAILTWTGTSSIGNTNIWDVNNEHNWIGETDNGHVITQFLNDDYVIFDDTGATTDITVQAEGSDTAVTVSGIVVKSSTNNYTFNGDGINGDNFIKQGSSTLTFNNTNNFNSISLESGRINIGNQDALTGSVITMSGGTTLGFNGDYSLSNNITLLAGDATFDTYSNSDELSGVISGIGSLTKTGMGTLTLSGSNTYSGGTAITGGTLNIDNNNAVGSGDVTMSDGTTLGFSDDYSLSNKIILLDGDATFDTDSNNDELSGDISGAGGLVKTGAGMLTLSGANSYGGDTTVAAGTLIGNIADNTALTVDSGATYETGSGALAADRTVSSLNGAGTVDMNSQSLTVGQGDFSGGTLLNVNKLTKNTTDTFTVGTATVDSAAVDDGTLVIAADKTLTVNGLIEVADSATLSVTAGNNPAVIAGSVDFGSDSFLNVGGYSGSQQGDTVTLIQSDTVITNLTNHYTIGGSTTVDYLSAQVRLADQKEVLADVALTWYDNHQNSFNQYDQAHGTFTIDGAGNSFTVITVLEDRTGTFTTNSWDGETLTKEGEGTLTLAGDNTYSGGTNLNQGRIDIGNDSALGTGALTMADGTTLGFAGNHTVGNDITLTGSATVNTESYSDTLTGVISGTGSLTKDGTGTLTLTNNNTYSGGTVIDAGTLVSQNAAALGDGLVENNAVLSLEFDGTFANGLQGAGSLITNGNITINNDNSGFSGSTTIAADTLTLSDANALGSGLVENNAVLSLEFDGTFANELQGAGSLTTNGTITISSDNSGFSGNTTIAADTLTLSDANALGSGLVQNNAALNLAFDGTFSNELQGAGSLTTNGNIIINNDNSNFSGNTTIASDTLTLRNNNALGSGLVQNDAALSLDFDGTFANELQGTGSLTTNGNIAINRDNSSFSGSTTIASDTLTLGDANAIGTGSVTMEDNTILGFAGSYTLNNAITLNGTATIDTTGYNETFNGVIDGAGVLTKDGAGTLILTNENTYTGGTVIGAGTLVSQNVDALGAGLVENNAALSLEFDGTFANELQGAGSLTTNGNITINRDNSGFSGGTTIAADTLTLGDSNALGSGLVENNAVLNLDFNGTFANDIQGTGDLIKAGSSEVILTGDNTYTGDTVIEAGTLTINNANSLSSSTNIENNGVLKLFASSTVSTIYSINSYSGSGIVGIKASLTAQDQWSDILEFTTTPQSVSVHFYFADGSRVSYLPDDGIQFAHLSTADGTDNTFVLDQFSSLAGASENIVITGDNQDYYLTAIFNPSLAKVYSKASAGELAQASWMHNRELFKATGEAARQADKDAPGVYAGFGRNDLRHETGSYADIKGNTLTLALALQADEKTAWGVFGRKFDGSYRTSHRASLTSGAYTVHSDGDLKTHDVGLFAEYRPQGEKETGNYYQAIVRAGHSTNDFSTATSYGPSAFRSGRSLYGFSLGGGYAADIGRGKMADYYSHLIYTKLGGDRVTDSIGQYISLQSSESVRLMSGVQFTLNKDRKVQTYFGAALDYEFSGKVDTYINGLKADGAHLKGLTGILEFGVSTRRSDTLTFDLSLQGYLGKKKGLGGILALSKQL